MVSRGVQEKETTDQYASRQPFPLCHFSPRELPSSLVQALQPVPRLILPVHLRDLAAMELLLLSE